MLSMIDYYFTLVIANKFKFITYFFTYKNELQTIFILSQLSFWNEF